MDLLTLAILLVFMTPGLIIFVFLTFMILMLLGLWAADGVRSLRKTFATWSYR